MTRDEFPRRDAASAIDVKLLAEGLGVDLEKVEREGTTADKAVAASKAGQRKQADKLESIELMLDEAFATLHKIRSAIAAIKAKAVNAAAKKPVRQEQKDRLWQRLCEYRSGASVSALRHDGGKVVLSYPRCVELLREFVEEHKVVRRQHRNERNHRWVDVYTKF
jgi:hypothetical protein